MPIQEMVRRRTWDADEDRRRLPPRDAVGRRAERPAPPAREPRAYTRPSAAPSLRASSNSVARRPLLRSAAARDHVGRRLARLEPAPAVRADLLAERLERADAQSTSRRSTAQRDSSWRLESWSLRRTVDTWASTVLTEIPRRRAISLYRYP